MVKKSKLFLSAFILFLVAFVPLSVAGLSFGDNSTYLPNGVKYSLVFRLNGYLENRTSGDVYYSQQVDFSVNFTLVSKRLGLDYIGWGALIDLPSSANLSVGGNSISKIPIPPIIAVKENTREIYFPDLLFKFLRGANVSLDLTSLALEVYQLKINTDFYVLNPFIIGSNIGVGGVVDYGFVNKTANKEFRVQGQVSDEVSKNIFGVNTVLLNVTLSYNSLLQVGSSFFNFFGMTTNYGSEVEAILNSTSLSIYLLYDKPSRWLVSSVLKVHFDNSTLPTNVTGYIDGFLSINMIDPGNVKIGGAGLLSRLLGVPDILLLGLDAILIALVLFYVARRSKK